MARGHRAEEEMEDLSCDTSKRTNTELQSPVCEVTPVLYSRNVGEIIYGFIFTTTVQWNSNDWAQVSQLSLGCTYCTLNNTK